MGDTLDHQKNMRERRLSGKVTERALYKIGDVKAFIERERRHDELGRLRMVQKQNATWRMTMLICILLNTVFIALGVIGLISR